MGDSDLRELTYDEFLATFTTKMTLDPVEGGVVEPFPELNAYAKKTLALVDPTGGGLAAVEIPGIYVDETETFAHFLLDFGDKNRPLVIVIHLPKRVVGHHLLDLVHHYGLADDSRDRRS